MKTTHLKKVSKTFSQIVLIAIGIISISLSYYAIVIKRATYMDVFWILFLSFIIIGASFIDKRKRI